MDQITDWLYISNYRASTSREWLAEAQIKAILHLAENVQHPNITTRYLPVEDGTALDFHYLKSGMEFVAEQRRLEHTMLIACGAGISRSATFCMAALKEQAGMSLTDAFLLIKKRHMVAEPHVELLKSLCKYYQAEAEFEPLWRLVSRLD